MHKNLPKRRKVVATFVTMLLITTLMASLLPEATATPSPIKIDSIDPQSGPVGETVRVIGEIDTLNGSYQILWDGKNVTEGTCKSGTKTVNDTFTVPPSVNGNHNVTLYDATNGNQSSPVSFTVTTSYHVSAEPARIQEGLNTTITASVNGGEANTVYFANITVTDPSGAVYYNDTLQLTNTTTTGSGNGTITYPLDFSVGAHTNYTGIYNIAFNKTLANGTFTVGLTNATEYHRFQVVGIRAVGYQTNESVWVNITRVKTARYPQKIVFLEKKNASAVGVIEANWTIPSNATMGLYTVKVVNSTTNGTVKLVPDNQNFTITMIPFQVKTVKLDGEVLADVKVEVYNATMELVAANITGKEGLAGLLVEGGGNYTFNASYNIIPFPDILYVPVGTLPNQTINRNFTLTLVCWIAYVRIEIDPPLPFIDITITYRYITSSFETNTTGIWEIRRNMPTNISYTIEARRYGSIFNTTNIEKLPAKINASWANITITCPTYTMFAYVEDSKGLPLQNVEVAVYEWSSGVTEPVQSKITNYRGSVTFDLTFGKYKIWVYNQNHTIVLNKTVVNLIKDQLFLVIQCKIFNVDLSVIVNDYVGHPIPNALVKVEREGVEIGSLTTGSNGTVSLHGIIGGDYRISVYVTENLEETRTLYLDETKVVVFKLDKYLVVGGYLMETTQLIAWISLGIMVALFVLALMFRRFRKVKEKSL